MSSRILYLSYDGMTDPLGRSQVIPYLRGLQSKGYDITLVSFEKPERTASRQEIERILADAGIRWIPMTYHRKPPILSTIRDIRSLKAKVFQLQTEKRFDIVHCRGYITAFAGEWMKKKWNTRFVFDIRGFFADERVEGGIWKRSNPVYDLVYRYFKRKEKMFFLRADHTVTLTYEGERIIRAFPYIPAGFRCSVIPCCVDLDLFKPVEGARPIEIPFPRICYLGSIGTWYMLDEMLAFFKNVLRVYPDAKFHFITHEPAEFILGKANEIGISSDRIEVGPASRKDLPRLLSTFDLSVFFILPVFSKKASSPTKQGELMAVGIPVICNAGVGDTDFIVNKYTSGFVIDNCTNEEYQRATDRLEEIAQLPKGPMYRGAEEYFSLKGGVERYARIYRELMEL